MSFNSNARMEIVIQDIALPQPQESHLQTTIKQSSNKKRLLKRVIMLFALGVFITGILVSLYIWKSNVQFHKSAIAASKSTPPSTTQPSSTAVAGYTVAPSLPRYIDIPKLNIHARVLSVGLTSSGALGVPSNVFDTAWYSQSSKPGQSGAMLIDGHVSSWTTHGVFYGIKSLINGDTIQIERGDGTLFTYKVVKTQVYAAGNVNMVTVMKPAVDGHPGLNLITCTGDVMPGTSDFSERVIVFAEQVS